MKPVKIKYLSKLKNLKQKFHDPIYLREEIFPQYCQKVYVQN